MKIRRRAVRTLATAVFASGCLIGATTAQAEWNGPEDIRRIKDAELGVGGHTSTDQTLDRQKLKITLPRSTILTYSGQCTVPVTGLAQRSQIGRFGRVRGQCPAIDSWLLPLHAQIPAGATQGILGYAGTAWVQSPVGTRPAFGVFPPVRVRSMAFGSIPVEATAHISQPVKDGLVEGFTWAFMTPQTYTPAGMTVPWADGPAPGYPYAFMVPPKFEGPLSIRLSDVTVDGKKVEVGGRCTSSGVFSATPRGGWYSLDYANDPPVKGEPGEWLPAFDGISYLPGNADIGPFTNCGTAGEDLNPLLTGLISGKNNPVDITQHGSIIRLWCDRASTSPPGSTVGEVYCDPENGPNMAPPGAGLTARQTAQLQRATSELLHDASPRARAQLDGLTPGMGSLQGQ